MLRRQTLSTNQESWQRALARAVDNDYAASLRLVGTYHLKDGSTETIFVVNSATTDNRNYTVRLFASPGRGVQVACDCEAGRYAKHFCWHEAAAALKFNLVAPPTLEAGRDGTGQISSNQR